MGLFGPDFSKEKREKIDKLVITTIEDEEIKSCLSRSLLATSLLTLGSTYGMYRVTKGIVLYHYNNSKPSYYYKKKKKGRTGLSKFFRIGGL